MKKIREQIYSAISAHGAWQRRLRTAVAAGEFELTPADCCRDDRCAFGQWFHGLDAATKATRHWQAVRVLHAGFHVEAGAVLEHALAGRKAEARSGLEGRFADASTQLSKELLAWAKVAK